MPETYKVTVAKKTTGENIICLGNFNDPNAPRETLTEIEVLSLISMLGRTVLHNKSDEDKGRMAAEIGYSVLL